MTLNKAFAQWASVGEPELIREIDHGHFIKMLTDSGIVDNKNFFPSDAEALFKKLMSKGTKRISLIIFREQGIPDIVAKLKRLTSGAIEEMIIKTAPKVAAKAEDPTRFHDDKSSYTGVYKAGGPTNVDRNSGSLAGVVDRRVSNDIRGAPTSQK